MENPRPAVGLTIAGFDPSSGAGITADLQVFAAHGLFGTAAITALTVQSTLGVAAVEPVAAHLLRDTLNNLQADLPAVAIKIGMLGSAAAVRVVAGFLADRPARGATPAPVVLDPVLRSSSGAELMDTDGLAALQSELLPRVDWIAPNWRELGVLSGRDIRNEQDAREAMEWLGRRYRGLGIVATGGELPEPVDLLRHPQGDVETILGQHVETTSTHGTGCAFSTALLCGLAGGASPSQAVNQAKRYVEGALLAAPGIGRGRGPMDLLWPLRP